MVMANNLLFRFSDSFPTRANTHTHTHTHTDNFITAWAFQVVQLVWNLPASAGFYPWVRKIPWRRKWYPTPIFLPGKPYRQRSPEGYSPWDSRVEHNWVTEHTHEHHISEHLWALGKHVKWSVHWRTNESPGVELLCWNVSWVQSFSHVFATPWTVAHQASLSITNSWSLLKLMSIELVMPPSHPLSSPSPPAFYLSQHQGLFQWVSSSHQAAKVLAFQL